ncbi:MAG: SDR family oxidoreductase [Microthrixaceae bacterium]
MDFEDSPELAAFRAEVGAFLAQHAEERRGDERDWSRNAAATDPAVAEEFRKRCREWQRLLYDNGWAGLTWPTEFGGRGLSAAHQIVFNQELARFDATSGFITAAQALVGPTIMKHGTPQQQRRYLPPLLAGDEQWCQLFSEPGAGSDLASLATRAVRDGDEWVVDGQKVWTSSAQHADFGILIARSDPEAPKHRGITYFIVDMTTPGVEVRPLVQAQGVAHFNEVFLSGVRIPTRNVVGEVGDGWRVARTTLRSESQMISGASQSTGFDAVLATARRTGATSDPRVRQELARVHTNEQVLRWMGWRSQTAVMTGRYELALHGSLLKNFFTRALSHRVELALSVEGPEGMLGADAEGDGFWQYQCLNQFAARIGGGTEEVHRNNLGEQVLGLPANRMTTATDPGRTRGAHEHGRHRGITATFGGGAGGRREAARGGRDARGAHRPGERDRARHGRDIALGLAAQGADVALLARSDRWVPSVAEEVRALGRRAVELNGSITSAEDCERVAGEVAEAFGGSLDVLVNSAFHAGEHVRFEDADLDRWRRPMEVNYFGTLQLTRSLLPALRSAATRTGDARVVMVNTMSVQHVEEAAGSYAASKAALGAVTKTLALELGDHGIRVNSVHPGYIWGDSVKIYFEWQAEDRGADAVWQDIYRERAAETALGYLPHSSEIAGAVVFLASPLARCVTGAAIPVNAGHWMPPSA